MHFKIAKSAQNYFDGIMNREGYTASDDKNKFIQFDIYYCCALIGMSACQLDEDINDLNDIVDKYPNAYRDYRAQIAGLLVATEAKRLGIDVHSDKLEEVMIKYLTNGGTLLTEEGVKKLNAYSLKGYNLIKEYPLIDKPTSREEFLRAFNLAINYYGKKEV